MLTRLVKMQFNEDFLAEFQETFKGVQPKIAAFKGCKGVQLLQDQHQMHTFFTISLWEDEEHLEDYRRSELFRETWTSMRPHFAAKPEAWSLLAP